MSDIKTTYTSNITQVENNNRRLERQNMKLIEQHRRMKHESRSTSRATAGAMSGMTSYATSLISSFLSVYAVIGQVRAALQDVDQYHTKLADRTMSVAAAQQKFVMMLDTKPGTAEKAIARIEDIAERVRPKGGKKGIYLTAAGAISAAGDRELGLQATELGTTLAPHDPEDARAITTAAIDMTKVTGSKDPRLNTGFLLAMVQKARAESITPVAQHGVKAMTAILSKGGSDRQAAALVASMSQAMADPTMRSSSQAATWFSEALNTYAPEKDIVETIDDPTTGRIRKLLRAKGTGLKSFAERRDYVMADAARLAEFEARFVSKAPMKSRGGVRAMLGISDKPELNKLAQESYLATLRDQPTVEEAGAFTDAKRRQLGMPFEGRLAEATYAKAAALERLDMTRGGQAAATAGVYKWEGTAEKPGLRDLLEGVGVGRFGRSSDYLQWRVMGGGRQGFEDVLQRRITGLRQSRPLAYEEGHLGQPTAWGVPSENIERAQYLESMVKRMAESLERQEGLIETQTGEVQQLNTAGLPAAANAQLAIGGE